MHQRASQFSHKALAGFTDIICRLILFVLFVSCGKPIIENSSQNQLSTIEGQAHNVFFDVNMSQKFSFLPLKGAVRAGNRFWSGDSWKHSKGSINYRWNAPVKVGFNYLSPTQWDAETLPVEKLKQLSPSEKYDLYMGRYDYPLKWEVDLFARSGQNDWEGICHGWAGATINHDEPQPRVMTNPDGIEIYFGSSDIKALLSYAYSKVQIRKEDAIGKRCEENGFLEDACDDDLSAMDFHVILTNKVGLREQPIIADLDRYKEVWNHPITKYESVIEKQTKEKVTLRTKITYIDVVDKNSWNPHAPVIGYMTMRYELELDSKGYILKGTWLSKNRPDFIWTVYKSDKFDGYLNGVLNLVK